jgi:glycosyltransferase involved in cell wall biosynthesis
MTLPLSVFIIAKDEADVIAHAIESVRGWVSEVLVVDSGSTDETITIAEKLGARVLHHDWEGYGQQKIFAESKCIERWVLNIDADEAVSPALAAEIQALFAKGIAPETSAFAMRWRLLFPHEKKPRRFAIGSTVVRLYDRERAGFRNSAIHDSVVVREGKTTMLRGLLWHRNFRSIAHWQKKVDVYSTMQAEDFFAKGRRPSTSRLLFEPLTAFFKSFCLRGYWAYGMDGVMISWLYAHAKYLRLIKARELFLKADVR